MRRTYRAVAERDGRWWFIRIPGEEGLFTQVKRLDQAEAMMREVIGLMRGVAEDSFDVVVEPDLASLGDLAEAISGARQAREEADAAQSRASAAMRHAVREIRCLGYTSRDAGTLLGVSNQRVSQLERERDKPT